VSDERTPLEYAVDWMEQQAWRNKNHPRNKSHPISFRHGVATRQQAAADAIRDMQAQLAAVTAQRDALARIADGFSTNVKYMLGWLGDRDENTDDAYFYMTYGQWAVNLKAWRKEHINLLKDKP